MPLHETKLHSIDVKTDDTTDKQTVEQTNKHIDACDDKRIDRQNDSKEGKRIDDDPFYWITENQAKVLSFLINQKNRITRLKDIVAYTGVPYGTVRGSIRMLVQEKCISKPVRYRRGQFHGISYRINDTLCSHFEYWQYDGPNDRQLERQLEKQTDSLSSSLFNKTTSELKETLRTHPELDFWRKKGLTAKQIGQWMKVADCSSDCIIQYLCYCSYEMETEGLEQSKPVNNVFNWFFRIIEKTGHYPKPKNYKPYQEIKNEHEYQIMMDKERTANESREIYKRRVEAEFEKLLYDTLLDRECDLYKQCFEEMSDFDRKRFSNSLKRTGKTFENAMRRILKGILEGEEA